MPEPRKYCFYCMHELPEVDGKCPVCGADNLERRNGGGELPFCRLAGKYLVGHAIARGGFGITYVGLDETENRRVAVKEYFPAGYAERREDGIHVRSAGPDADEAFETGKMKALQEAGTIARVQDVPGVVRVYDCFTRNNTVYIIMEFIDGKTYSALIEKNGPEKWQELWPRLRPIAEALARMHQINLIHRDISPDNLMVREEDGSCVLLDFGAASGKIMANQEHAKVLKDGYAAMEQYQDRGEINGRADEYSFCATLYYLLTGERPPTPQQRRYQDAKLRLPIRLNKEMPDKARAALVRGMSVRQEDRYPDMEELIFSLDARKEPLAVWRIALGALAGLSGAVMAAALAAGLLL